jgi:hypothetical protein
MIPLQPDTLTLPPQRYISLCLALQVGCFSVTGAQRMLFDSSVLQASLRSPKKPQNLAVLQRRPLHQETLTELP